MQELPILKNDDDYIQELRYQLLISRDILRALIASRDSVLSRLGLNAGESGLVYTGQQILDRPFPTRPNPRRN